MGRASARRVGAGGGLSLDDGAEVGKEDGPDVDKIKERALWQLLVLGLGCRLPGKGLKQANVVGWRAAV